MASRVGTPRRASDAARSSVPSNVHQLGSFFTHVTDLKGSQMGRERTHGNTTTHDAQKAGDATEKYEYARAFKRAPSDEKTRTV